MQAISCITAPHTRSAVGGSLQRAATRVRGLLQWPTPLRPHLLHQLQQPQQQVSLGR